MDVDISNCSSSSGGSSLSSSSSSDDIGDMDMLESHHQVIFSMI